VDEMVKYTNSKQLLAEAIKKKRGLENVPERYRRPASFREVLASVQIRLDVPESPLLNTQ